MSVSIYFHIAVMNNYQNIVNDIVDSVSDVGLYDMVDSINVGVVGGSKKHVHTLPDKYKVRFESHNLKLYEKPTLAMLHEDCKTSTGKVLYIHTKNARTVPCERHVDYAKWKSWASREVHRKYMLNFNIQHYTQRLNDLEDCDAVGCDFRNKPENSSHFAGNFWWANCSFIKTLPGWSGGMFPISGPMGRQARHYCERWLLCYNNRDNDMSKPVFKSIFYGGECRKNDSLISKILSNSREENNALFDQLHIQQLDGKFPIRI